jgi:hypothetical protein
MASEALPEATQGHEQQEITVLTTAMWPKAKQKICWQSKGSQ